MNKITVMNDERLICDRCLRARTTLIERFKWNSNFENGDNIIMRYYSFDEHTQLWPSIWFTFPNTCQGWTCVMCIQFTPPFINCRTRSFVCHSQHSYAKNSHQQRCVHTHSLATWHSMHWLCIIYLNDHPLHDMTVVWASSASCCTWIRAIEYTV